VSPGLRHTTAAWLVSSLRTALARSPFLVAVASWSLPRHAALTRLLVRSIGPARPLRLAPDFLSATELAVVFQTERAVPKLVVVRIGGQPDESTSRIARLCLLRLCAGSTFRMLLPLRQHGACLLSTTLVDEYLSPVQFARASLSVLPSGTFRYARLMIAGVIGRE
jgi:hypothetical protein